MPVEADFWTRYSSLCLQAKVCPLQSVFKRLKGTEFHCVVEVIRRENWPFLLAALSDDTSLTKIQFISNHSSFGNQKEIGYEKNKRSGLLFPVPYGCSEKNVTDICRCVAQVLSNSQVLTVLKIENLYLKEEDALILEKALKGSCVEQFSLSGCKFQGDAFEIVCRGLQLSKVQWIDFSSCNLNASSLSSVCKIIKTHNVRRGNEMFQHTLRSQIPVFDEMKGLNRITLNNNKIGDEAVEMLGNSLCEDVWIKALDLQKCCIENNGATAMLCVAKRNAGIQLIDLRLNDIDEAIVDRIALQLALNNVDKVLKYNLGNLWKPPKYSKKIANHKAYLKTKVLKQSPPRGKLLKKEPTRASVRTISKTISTEEVSSQTELNYNKELKKAKKILSKHYSLLNLLKKYKRENYLLQKEVENLSMQDDYILIDHETFSEVRNTFEKFKKFLDMMKDYGLWECVAILEANESAGNILKPLIFDAIKKCLKILNSDSSNGKISQTDNVSFNDLAQEMLHFRKHSEILVNQKLQHHPKPMPKNNVNEHKLFISRVLPEENRLKNSMSSEKALAQKLFKEVMESYTSSSHSSGSTKPVPNLPVHAKTEDVSQVSRLKNCLSETAHKINQLKMSKDKFSSISNNHAQSTIGQKPFVSHVPSTSTQRPNENPQDLSNKSDFEKESRKAIESVPEISLSSGETLPDGTSTLRKSSEVESEYSSTYKTLPDFKQTVNDLPDENVPLELLSNKDSFVHSSKTNSKSSLSSYNQTTSGSESSKSSRQSKAKVASHKSKPHSSSSSGKHITTLMSKQPMPEVPENNAAVKSSSSAASVSSKNSFLLKESVHGSAEEVGSEKSYLESVDEASTDKDVKSLSEEVYSSEDDKEDQKVSVSTNMLVKEQVQEEVSLPVAEMHSELLKKSVHSSNTKSSVMKLTLKNATVKSSVEKPEKNKSDSSMPSLSDITTVSSHSLNTDSVMGQLSD